MCGLPNVPKHSTQRLWRGRQVCTLVRHQKRNGSGWAAYALSLTRACCYVLQGGNGKFSVLVDVPFKVFADDFSECQQQQEQ
jgi:hypothetical protein